MSLPSNHMRWCITLKAYSLLILNPLAFGDNGGNIMKASTALGYFFLNWCFSLLFFWSRIFFQIDDFSSVYRWIIWHQTWFRKTFKPSFLCTVLLDDAFKAYLKKYYVHCHQLHWSTLKIYFVWSNSNFIDLGSLIPNLVIIFFYHVKIIYDDNQHLSIFYQTVDQFQIFLLLKFNFFFSDWWFFISLTLNDWTLNLI